MPHKPRQSWRKKVLSADKIWAQLNNELAARGLELPETPRRPDVRLIVNNVSGVDKIFHNPGDHSNSLAEHVPAAGDKTAAMVMVEGDTLAEQYRNARTLFEKYKLGEKGLSDEFVQALGEDNAGGLVREAYGPAPYDGQSQKLVPVGWENLDGTQDTIKPVFGKAASYGARKIDSEKVFSVDVEIYVKGSTTVPEAIEDAVMQVAVTQDWETGQESTRPIVPSISAEFYGRHYDDIPSVLVNPNGLIKSIDLKNGTEIDLYPSGNSGQKFNLG